MTFALLALILIGILVAVIFLEFQKIQNEWQKHSIDRNLPGPWGLPLLGHLVSLGLNPHLKLIKWKQKYGPIISCRFGSFPTVVLCDSKVIKEAFSMVEFSGRLQLQAFVEGKITKGLGLSEGPYYTELRHFVNRKLKEFGVGRKTLEIEDKIHQGVAELVDFIRKREGLPVKSEDVPSSHIVQTLWTITMTDKINPEEAEALNTLLKMMSQLGPVVSELANFMPWMETLSRILSLGSFSLISPRLNEIKDFTAFFAKMIQEKKNGNKTESGRNKADIMDIFLEKMEQTTDESSPFHFSHDAGTYLLADVFGGGIHTVHTTLVWLLYSIARNPEVKFKLQEEIGQVIGASKLPSLSDRGQMPYADGVIHEVLRFYPAVPLALPHKTTADVRFHGYTIKKGTMILANIYGVHHDPEIWGDPENFRPERWLGDSGKKLKSEHFLPFSTGRRICPGEGLAREQLFLYVTTLFQKYSVDFFGKKSEVKGVFGMILTPSEFTLVFNKRKNVW